MERTEQAAIPAAYRTDAAIDTALSWLPVPPLSRTPGETTITPVAASKPPRLWLVPVSFRNDETHAILECLLFPPISLFLFPVSPQPLLGRSFFFPSTSPTFARTSLLPSLVLGASARNSCGCAAAPVPAANPTSAPSTAPASRWLPQLLACRHSRHEALGNPARTTEIDPGSSIVNTKERHFGTTHVLERVG